MAKPETLSFHMPTVKKMARVLGTSPNRVPVGEFGAKNGPVKKQTHFQNRPGILNTKPRQRTHWHGMFWIVLYEKLKKRQLAFFSRNTLTIQRRINSFLEFINLYFSILGRAHSRLLERCWSRGPQDHTVSCRIFRNRDAILATAFVWCLGFTSFNN